MRQEALIDQDRPLLAKRIGKYFDKDISIAELQADASGPAYDMARFNASKARKILLEREVFQEANIRPFQQRPFDKAWCYFTETRPIWNEPRPELARLVDGSNPV